MDQASINLWAVLAAVVVKQALRFAWYSPVLFGPAFTAATGQTPEDMRPRLPKAIALDIVSALVLALALAHVVSWAAVVGPLFGALVGLVCWAGFAAAISLTPTLFEQRALRAWALQNGYLALAFSAMGAILGGWR